jgi:hypothetical protein
MSGPSALVAIIAVISVCGTVASFAPPSEWWLSCPVLEAKE